MLLFDRRTIFHAAGDVFSVDGTPGNRGVWQEDRGQFLEGPVFSANGGSAAYRRAMLDDVGLLDESFYFSLEDVDLGWRAQLRGWTCIYAPKAVVYHKLSATGGGVTHSFYNGRNFLYVLAKDVPGPLLAPLLGAHAARPAPHQPGGAARVARARGARPAARPAGRLCSACRASWPAGGRCRPAGGCPSSYL